MAVRQKGAARIPLNVKVAMAREIIDRYAIGVPFSEGDLRELADLTDTELRYAVRQKNPMFPGDRRHLHVIAYDWLEPQQWSWRSALQIAHSRDPEEARANRERQKVMFALRFAVKSDMDDFRSACIPAECAVCGAIDDLTTDHVTPPFVAIAREFLKIHPVIELRTVQGCGDLIASPDIEAEWIAFHAARAVYQLLCRSCNSSKGAR